MKQCELSVIIPVYNGERFLEDTLTSVLQQTYKDFELILVDDGSTDNTPQICEEYAKKDRRIKVIHQKNGGMSNARDNGYKIASDHTWIAFLDADDIFSPNMFEDMMKYKEAEIVCVCYKNVNSNKISAHPMDTSNTSVEPMSGREMLYRCFYPHANKGSIGNLWGMLINREFYNKMEPIIRQAETVLPQNYLNDVYCVPRFLMNASNAILLNEVYILHRISKFADSRLIKPNALHYELALANKMNLDYYEDCDCDFACEKQLTGFYLVILKIWYQTVTMETDEAKKNEYIALIQDYYKVYYDKLRNVKCNSISEYMVKRSIMLWGISKTLWRLTIGSIKYGIMYRLQI